MVKLLWLGSLTTSDVKCNFLTIHNISAQFISYVLSLTLFQHVYQIICIFAPCFENLQLSEISDYVWKEPLLLPNNQLFRLYHPLNWAKFPIFIEYDLLFCCKSKNVLGKHRKIRNFVLKYLRQKFPFKLKVYIASKLPLHFFQSVLHFPSHFFSATQQKAAQRESPPISISDVFLCRATRSCWQNIAPIALFTSQNSPNLPCHVPESTHRTAKEKTSLRESPWLARILSAAHFMWNCVSPLFSFKGLPLPINPALWCQAGGLLRWKTARKTHL